MLKALQAAAAAGFIALANQQPERKWPFSWPALSICPESSRPAVAAGVKQEKIEK